MDERWAGFESAFSVVNLQVVAGRFRLWKKQLPGIRPFYAVKANPEKLILQKLIEAGAGVDCASVSEVQVAISAGCPVHDIVLSNPHKSRPEIRRLKQVGVQVTVVDSICEMDKIAEEWPEVSVLLRLAVSTKNCGPKMEGKFGTSAKECLELLSYSREKRLTVKGICFHLGSTGSTDRIDSFRSAFSDIAHIFYEAREKHGINLTMVDIGGGFVWDSETFVKQATTLKEEVDKLVARLGNKVQIIAEPGTFFVQQAGFSAARVICTKMITNGANETRPAYVIDDGVFGSFNVVLSYPGCFESDVVTKAYRTRPDHDYLDCEPRSSILFGHTCDPCDVISRQVSLPLLKEGDWVWFEGLGSYGHCVSKCFNGFPGPQIVYFDGSNSFFPPT